MHKTSVLLIKYGTPVVAAGVMIMGGGGFPRWKAEVEGSLFVEALRPFLAAFD